MKLDLGGNRRTLIALCLISTLSVVSTSKSSFQPQEPTPRPMVLYLDDGAYTLTLVEKDGVPYFALGELVRRLALAYTDATALGVFTIQGPATELVLDRNTARITLGDRELAVDPPVVNEGGRWLAPLRFLNDAVGPLLGISFRVMPSRIIASNVSPTSLGMEATAEGGITRLTLKLSDSSNVRVQQEADQNRVILNIDRAPLIPGSETLDYRDSSIRSVSFDDTDGQSRLVVETTPQVVNVRLIPADGNRTFMLELVPAEIPVAEVTAAPGPVAPSTDAVLDRSTGPGPIRTIVIDPGHGGLDNGTGTHGILEKDLTLVLAQRLQATLEARLGVTVILTRARDLPLPLESRTAIANENRADLFVSLHVGFSPDPTESRVTVFVMHDPGESGVSAGGTNLFLPWYDAQRKSRARSVELAEALVAGFSAQVPEWPAELGAAPLAILAGATMPAVVAELGNANNPEDLERLSDPAFQNRLIEALLESIQPQTARSSPDAA